MKTSVYKNPEFKKVAREFAATAAVLIVLYAVILFYFSNINSSIKNTLILILILLAQIIEFFCLYKYASVIYKKLQIIILGTEKVMRGNYDLKLPEEHEGHVAILGFQYNQICERLKLTLEQLEKEKEGLKIWISDISHQLKTPLSVVKMFNEIMISELNETEVNREEFNQFLSKSMRQIERMEWLIQSILKLSKLQSGTVVMKKSCKNIIETVEAAVHSVEQGAVNKNQKIIMNAPCKEVNLEHDGEWLEEAIKNIIKNSVDYTPEGGEIIVSVEKCDGYINISIKDSGIGIPSEDIPHIFERFYISKIGGTGLGLALSKFIVEQHNGYIKIKSGKSVESGTGTEVIISLLNSYLR